MNILIVGNSFSRDSFNYLHEIAQSMNVDITTGLLYAGGRDLTYHYDTRESEINWFYINTMDYRIEPLSKTMSLKRVLTEYSWDTVVIQNYCSRVYTDIEESRWHPVGENLANYILSIAPNVRIMVNQTWSFAEGFHYDGMVNIDRELQLNYDRYLEEQNRKLAETIGHHTIVVPVGKAIANARADACGLFNGKYAEPLFRKAADEYPDGTGYFYGYGIRSAEDEAAGRVILNRDGFHLSPLGRYLAATVWFETLTGIDMRSCQYQPSADILGCHVVDSNGRLFYLFGEFVSPERRYLDKIGEIAHQTVTENIGM